MPQISRKSWTFWKWKRLNNIWVCVPNYGQMPLENNPVFVIYKKKLLAATWPQSFANIISYAHVETKLTFSNGF